ncbi:hypothetical protein KEM52_002683 [Ascosphaera acerosa]|nr:hypothetical protein KEM52_002683 [Ascosphaera acerosa]
MLCWSQSDIEPLTTAVQRSRFEAHPSSGEIEVPDPVRVCYRLYDEETLRATIVLAPHYDLAITYQWHPDLPGDQGAPAWKVHELLPWQDDRGLTMRLSASIDEAVREWESQLSPTPTRDIDSEAGDPHAKGKQEKDEEDDYWSLYDKQGGETPQRPSAQDAARIESSTVSDSHYYERYNHVQPALESDETAIDGAATANGDLLHMRLLRHAELAQALHSGSQQVDQAQDADRNQRALFPGPVDKRSGTSASNGASIAHPQPRLSPPSSHLSAIDKLEAQAKSDATAIDAIRRHAAATIGQLYTLMSVGAGMSKTDFTAFVDHELKSL